MGRRKIEIKPIKDDRNRSVTFLKRKGGLFKKAHELSVLCSVDVAVIIFGAGTNKKLHEFSSMDMREMIQRYGCPPYPIMRHHTPSASPDSQWRVCRPPANGPRGHTPQPQMGSRPSSRNDMHRMGANMAGQPLPAQPIPHMTPPPPQPQAHPMQSPPQPQQHILPPPPPPQLQLPQESQAEPRPKPELVDRPRQPPLLDTKIKQAPRKGGSIFTPIDENRSILSQHLAAFHPEPKSETPSNRSQSVDVGSVSRPSNPNSPPSLHRLNTQLQQPQIKRNGSLGTIPETTFTPPSRSNSLRVGGSISRPRLKVQIPDESDGGSATNESGSPRGTTATGTDITSQHSRRLTDSHSSGVVLPPPSPSASTLLSAGATGPPNPFARPPPHQNNMNIDTPVSALPSRFLGEGYLPSPSGFYSDLFSKGNDNNTLSPLNFGTPVVGTGPSFLRDDPLILKRKSPDLGGNGGHSDPVDALANEAKRVKVDH
ncbi:hypothetical protein NEMBOFW57_002955 [Staphylotrichum longicolle]|uniref:MADS-box domain-containing protein n=1 Tax=Staphylotrichum longicolle TaxID=669026 RepID=A0AAD4F5A4_9PEZI|nr:hypothetical protein NEMBOFW57_002955 [Staphylotrichum longicolle]